ncbi:hypothetical protein EDD22DRAFT_904530, partial [Suillus occidentalis]
HCDHRNFCLFILLLPPFQKHCAAIWFAATNDEDTRRKGSITSFNLFYDMGACFPSHQHVFPPSISFIPFTRVHSSS